MQWRKKFCREVSEPGRYPGDLNRLRPARLSDLVRRTFLELPSTQRITEPHRFISFISFPGGIFRAIVYNEHASHEFAIF
jgi:hypothetical protein